MIELTADDDPMLFAATVSSGKIIIQYMEVIATMQAGLKPNEEPQPSMVLQAMREASRTKDIAAKAGDAELIALWHRMTTRLQAQGNV